MKISKNKLAVAMLKSGIISFKELATLSGVSQNSIASVTNGRAAKIETVGKLADALKCDPIEILQED